MQLTKYTAWAILTFCAAVGAAPVEKTDVAVAGPPVPNVLNEFGMLLDYWFTALTNAICRWPATWQLRKWPQREP